MRQRLLFLLFICTAVLAKAQTFKVTGRVTNAAREPVAFVSVQVKERHSGTVTKEDGTYTLTVEEGKYDLIYSIIGYKPQVVPLVVTKNYIQNIILEEENAILQNVTIKTKYKDGAADLIRNVIRRKDSLAASVGSWSSKVYIKAVQQDSSSRAPKRKSKKDSATLKMDRDIAGMAMTEVSLKLDYASEQRIKEERLGIKK